MGANHLNWTRFEILGPQIVLLLTAVALAMTVNVHPVRHRSAAVMICFSGLVVATLAHLWNYSILSAGGAGTVSLPSWLVFDSMGWILSLSILLIATAAMMLRRLRYYSGRDDGRLCLLFTLSVCGWSLLPMAADFSASACCMLLATIPLLAWSAYGWEPGPLERLANRTLAGCLAMMLLALLVLRHTTIAHAVVVARHGVNFSWHGLLIVLFLLPMIYWVGVVPLVWWFGDATRKQPLDLAFVLPLVPFVGSMAELLRVLRGLYLTDPAAADVVVRVLTGLGIAAVVAYGIKALRQSDLAGIAGNMIGILAATTLVAVSAAGPFHFGLVAKLVGCLAMYALTAGLAAGLALGIAGGEKPWTLEQLPEFARTKVLSTLVLILALLSLAGLPPTMGFIDRMELFRVIGYGSVMETGGILALDVLSIALAGVAALRVAAYACAPMAEPAVNVTEAVKKPRRARRMELVPLALLLLASVVNGAALCAYNPIQNVASSFTSMHHSPVYRKADP